MNATWPMVLAALVGGFLVGALVPANNEPAKVNLPGGATIVGEISQKPSSSNEPGTRPVDPPKVTPSEVDRPAQDKQEKEKKAGACQKEAWPYYGHNCLDAAASIREPVEIVRVHKQDPAIAMQEEDKPKTDIGNAAPRGAAQAGAQPKSAGYQPASAGAQNDAATAETAKQKSAPPQQPRRRSRAQAREAEFYMDRRGPPARVMIMPDGRRIYVYPHARGERWGGPPPW